ncbi:MAG: hypothetical protein H6754_02930 [Candidatus Omnitrophica bacterium]|nr:hypothetical protein [Candidatus Omnitrophota bacterium]
MNKKSFFLLLSIVYLLTFSSSSHAAEPNLVANFYIEAGKKHFKVKDYDLAIREFNKALLADPNNEEALMYLRMLGFGGTQKTEQYKKVAATPTPVLEKVKEVSETTKNDVGKSSKKEEAQKIKAIEEQTAKEEMAALKALRLQADEDKKAALKEVRAQSKKEKSVKNKPAIKKAKSSQAKDSKKVIDRKVVVSDENMDKDNDVHLSLDSSMDDFENQITAAAAVYDKEKQSAVTPPKSTKIEEKIDKSKKIQTSKKTQSPATAVDVAQVSNTVAQDKEKAAIFKIQTEARGAKTRLQDEIAAQTADKIAATHKKFSARKVAPNEKMVPVDIDGDGIKEVITLKENAAIENIKKQADKQEQAGLKVIEKKAEQKQRIALRKISIESSKNKKLAPKMQKIDKDIPAKKSVVDKVMPVASHDDDFELDDSEYEDIVDEHSQDSAVVIDADDDEEDVLAKLEADQALKEKELRQSFAQKKAEKIKQVRKNYKVNASRVEKMPLDAIEDDDVGSEESLDMLVAQEAVSPAVKAVQKQNIVLKKKLAEIVDMSQKDQVLIQDLEKSSKQKDQKVAVLETDLVEAKTDLEVRRTKLKEQGQKLMNLQARIDAMETDVHSKQYNFKDRQLEYEKKIQAIEEEFGNYKSQKAQNEEELQDQLRTLKEALAKKIKELNDAQAQLLFTENKLHKSEELYTAKINQYEEVKKTLADLESRLSGMQSSGGDKTDTALLVEIDPQNLPAPRNKDEEMYQQWIQRHDKLVTRLKEKLLWAGEQIEYLGRYDIKLSDQKMAALKEQLAMVKKQLSEKNAIAGGKPEDYALMEARFKDSQERLEMVEKILREKDDQIKELEKQLNSVLSAF